MELRHIFLTVYQSVKQDVNYVPRQYQTIGGAWTRDTWKAGHWTVYMEDEGYTRGLQYHNAQGDMILNVTTTMAREPVFHVGSEELFRSLTVDFLP